MPQIDLVISPVSSLTQTGLMFFIKFRILLTIARPTQGAWAFPLSVETMSVLRVKELDAPVTQSNSALFLYPYRRTLAKEDLFEPSLAKRNLTASCKDLTSGLNFVYLPLAIFSIAFTAAAAIPDVSSHDGSFARPFHNALLFFAGPFPPSPVL